jgi:hypothetical protein
MEVIRGGVVGRHPGVAGRAQPRSPGAHQRGDHRSHPGQGVWIESVISDEGGTWYGYYHHEVAGEICGRPLQSIVRIGAARSFDRGLTWENLGFILEAPPDDIACGTVNRYVLGGVGDLSAVLDPAQQDLFLFVSQYSKDRWPGSRGGQDGLGDRDTPEGRVTCGGTAPGFRHVERMLKRTVVWSYAVGTHSCRCPSRGMTAIRRRMRSGGHPCTGTHISSVT